MKSAGQGVRLKSAGGFRGRYAPIAAEILETPSTGRCDSGLTPLPFTTIPRPLWPFDQDLEAPWADGGPVVITGAAS